jgi:tetratricopeptide (TPR) repeat protein
VYYDGWGSGFTFRYVYPYYHRRYVFVSLGGYWPIGYSYLRYHWYGCHPYNWYGYYPIAREVQSDTYNYYTYNYYTNGSAAALEPYQAADSIVDHTTFADVREKLARQAAEVPDPETLVDSYFEGAVKAFETGEYDSAASMFAKAIDLAPDDMVLPFAYSQALFANEKYPEAAELLRAALAKVLPEEQGVFYPRGLYPDDDVLFDQIDRLAERAELYSFDADLQLLLGYHLLGIGRIEEAVIPLQQAGQDLQNTASAAVLLDLLEKIRTQKAEDNGQ